MQNKKYWSEICAKMSELNNKLQFYHEPILWYSWSTTEVNSNGIKKNDIWSLKINVYYILHWLCHVYNFIPILGKYIWLKSWKIQKTLLRMIVLFQNHSWYKSHCHVASINVMWHFKWAKRNSQTLRTTIQTLHNDT